MQLVSSDILEYKIVLDCFKQNIFKVIRSQATLPFPLPSCIIPCLFLPSNFSLYTSLHQYSDFIDTFFNLRPQRLTNAKNSAK